MPEAWLEYYRRRYATRVWDLPEECRVRQVWPAAVAYEGESRCHVKADCPATAIIIRLYEVHGGNPKLDGARITYHRIIADNKLIQIPAEEAEANPAVRERLKQLLAKAYAGAVKA